MRTSAIASLSSTALFLDTPQHALEQKMDAGIRFFNDALGHGWQYRIDFDLLRTGCPFCCLLAQVTHSDNTSACLALGLSLEQQEAFGLTVLPSLDDIGYVLKKDREDRLTAIVRQRLQPRHRFGRPN